MLRLKGAVQHYDWGHLGEASEVGRLHALSTGNDIEEGKPYAELWMGTHPSGPSIVLDDESSSNDEGVSLNEWLREHPEALGDSVATKWQGELPFLFKVLSISDALSIQAHPDKLLAEHLHRTQPHVYKDPNHKPEMALALTEFKALCGFLSPDELRLVLRTFPELRSVLKEQDVAVLTDAIMTTEIAKSALQRAFGTIMTMKKEEVTETVRALTGRLTKEKESGRKMTSREDLVLLLEKQFPDDVGVLASLFLNYIHLNPGQAVFLAANVPHAYISGDCVECMATSDNVVRAGLTPKYRDTETLCSMLTYEQGLPDILEGHQVSPGVKCYSPPFEEFEVDVITVPFGTTLPIPAIAGPSIVLVLGGAGLLTVNEGVHHSAVRKGDIYFLPAGKEFSVSTTALINVHGKENGNANGNANGNGGSHMTHFSESDPVRMYRARVHSKILQ